MFKGLRTARILASGLVSSTEVISRLDYRVGLTDCDFNRHLTNSRYPAYMDLGRWDIMVKSGALMMCVRKRLTPVVVEMNLAFRKELPYGTSFTLDTRLVSVERRIISFDQTFLVEGEPYFRGEVRSLVLHRGKVVNADDFSPFVAEPLKDRVDS